MDEDTLVLRDNQSGEVQLFQRSDDYSGYTIRIGDRGYEFVRSIKPEELESLADDQTGMAPDVRPDDGPNIPSTEDVNSAWDLTRRLGRGEDVHPTELRDHERMMRDPALQRTIHHLSRQEALEPWERHPPDTGITGPFSRHQQI